MNKPRLWFFSELFYPDETSTGYILGEIAKACVAEFDVHVITGPEGYEKRLVNIENDNGYRDIHITRLKIPNFNKDKVLGRIFRMAILSALFAMKFLRSVKRGDKVVLVTNPAPMMLVIGLLNKIKKAETSLIVHDVFPENMIAANLISKNAFFQVMKYAFDNAYRSYGKLFVLGRDMKDIMNKKLYNSNKSQVYVIENWGDEENLFPLITDKYNSFKDSRISFVFAGNVGRVQGLDKVVTAFAKYQDSLTLTIIGNGACKSELQQFVSSHNIQNIRFLEALARKEQIHFINSFDVSIVSLEMGMYGLGVPSKTYNILITGKPVLYIGPEGSEIDLLVKEHHVGWSATEWESLEDILSNFGKGGMRFPDRDHIRSVGLAFSKEKVIARYLQAIRA